MQKIYLYDQKDDELYSDNEDNNHKKDDKKDCYKDENRKIGSPTNRALTNDNLVDKGENIAPLN